MKKARFKIGILAAALAVALMAAMHGLMGESAFKLLSATINPALLLGATLPMFALLAFTLWQKDALTYRICKRFGWPVMEQPHSHALGPLVLAITIFVFTSLAQGVVAISGAHLAAHYSHHAYGFMLGLGLILFVGGTVALWMMRDSLFHVEAKVDPINNRDWPFHVALVSLSTPGRGEPSDYTKDKAAFAMARTDFDRILDTAGWQAAVDTLREKDRKFAEVPFWNFQQPLRLLETMANSKYMPNKRRAMIFVTTKESDARWPDAKKLLDRVAETMPVNLGPQIDIRSLDDLSSILSKHSNPESRRFNAQYFNDMFQLFRDAIEAIKSEYKLPSKSIAIDTTSGTKEMSIVGAVATIDSHIAFTYVDTNDLRARRFDARAMAVGISE